MNNPKYSVIIPVFNSECTLVELYSLIKSVFQELNESFETIFVEDCSKDNSWSLIQEVKTKNPDDDICLIKLTKNHGQHKATLCGINSSKGDFIITIDDDLQILPCDIVKLIDAQRKENCDLVYGNYPDKKHSAFRNFGSKTVNKVFIKDVGSASSFRLFTDEMKEKIQSQHRDFVNIDEMLYWFTGNISYVLVEHNSSKKKKSGYSTFSLFRMVKNIFLFSTNFPLKIMVYSGMIFSFISFMIGLYFIFRKLFYKVPLGYTSLIVAILFSTSILLLSLGIIGEYLSRIYHAQNSKPPYLIRKIIK
ncbi:MAG: glycosyltransferase [Bacteroidota bacterium]